MGSTDRTPRKGTRQMVAAKARRMAFAREYLIDQNAGKAAVRAGYGEAGSRAMGCRLLKVKDVAEFIAKHEARMAAKYQITAERVLAEYAVLAFSDVRDLFNADGSLKAPDELSDAAARAIGSVEVKRERRRGRQVGQDGQPVEEEIVKVRLWDKLRALEACAKHTGVLKEPAAAPGSVMWTLDPEKLAKMTDAEIDAAVASARLLTGAA